MGQPSPQAPEGEPALASSLRFRLGAQISTLGGSESESESGMLGRELVVEAGTGARAANADIE
jgi:hypothetical protein